MSHEHTLDIPWWESRPLKGLFSPCARRHPTPASSSHTSSSNNPTIPFSIQTEAPPALGRLLPFPTPEHEKKLKTYPKRPPTFVCERFVQNRQSPTASVQRTQTALAGHSAVPHGTDTTPMNANRAIPNKRRSKMPRFCIFQLLEI